MNALRRRAVLAGGAAVVLGASGRVSWRRDDSRRAVPRGQAGYCCTDGGQGIRRCGAVGDDGSAVEKVNATAAAPVRRRLALPVLLLGSFIGVLDPFVVTVALPTIRADLAASAAQTQWMIAGYGATYGIGLLLGGRLGDRYGRRRLFLSGLVAYAVASAAAGAAPVVAALVAARLAQGAAAAAMLPQVLSIVRAVYPEPQRSRAVGWYGMTVGLGVVSGPVLAGLLVGADVAGLGWRTAFLVNVPLGLAVAAGAALTVPESRAAGVARLDLAGAGLGAAALTAFFVPVSVSADAGWQWWTVASLVSAPVFVAAFLAHQRRVERRGGSSVLPVHLFRQRRFALGMAAVLMVYVAGVGAPFLFVLSYYVQDALGGTALAAGGLLAPVGLGFAVASASAPRLHRRWGLVVAAVGNGVVVACLAGIVLVTVLVRADLRPALYTCVLLLAGVGQGLTTNPVIAVVLASVPDSAAGAASGLLLTTTQVGNIAGVTVVGSVFLALLPPDGAGEAAYVPALAWSVTLLAALTLVTLAVVLALRRVAESTSP